MCERDVHIGGYINKGDETVNIRLMTLKNSNKFTLSGNFGLQVGNDSLKLFVFHFEKQKGCSKERIKKNENTRDAFGMVSGTVSTTRKHRPTA